MKTFGNFHSRPFIGNYIYHLIKESNNEIVIFLLDKFPAQGMMILLSIMRFEAKLTCSGGIPFHDWVRVQSSHMITPSMKMSHFQ